MNRVISWCGVFALLFLPACGDDKPTGTSGGGSGTPTKSTPKSQSPKPKKPARPVRIDRVMAKALWGMEPAAPKVDNPSTPEKIALGRTLFHETLLSKGGEKSCASCHDLANYGQDNKPKSPGSGGQMTERNTPTVWNASRQYRQLWDYRGDTTEQVIHPIGHGLDKEEQIVARINEKPELVAAFGKAFPGEGAVTAANVSLALGAFQRTLVTRSRFDDFLDGDTRALTNAEKAGLKEFMDVGCQTCHMSRLVGGSMPQKVGVYRPYPDEDTGRHKVTGTDAEKFMFKVPTLLNVEKTAPYNHDGGVAGLEEAVKQMADIQLDKKITDEQVASIVTFLKTLTGKLPAEIVNAK